MLGHITQSLLKQKCPFAEFIQQCHGEGGIILVQTGQKGQDENNISQRF